MHTKKPTSPSISPWSSCSSLPATSPPLHLLRLQTCRAHRRATLLTRPPGERVSRDKHLESLRVCGSGDLNTGNSSSSQLHLSEIHQLCGSGKKNTQQAYITSHLWSQMILKHLCTIVQIKMTYINFTSTTITTTLTFFFSKRAVTLA